MAVYSQCELCRRHHNEGRRHIYQKKHKERLKEVLGKFTAKARSARRLLPRPKVVEGELEPGACLWCYCCSEEVEQHRTDREVTVAWGGMLEHMGSARHWRQTRQFLYRHGAGQELAGQLTVTEEELTQFKARVGVALDKMAATREQERERLAAELRQRDEVRQAVAMEVCRALWRHLCSSLQPTGPEYRSVRSKHGVLQNPTGWHEGRRVWGGGVVKYKHNSNQLLKWEIDDLTDRLLAPQSKCAWAPTPVAVGNVHTGAVPPWLREEEGEASGLAEIGPSEKEFRLHQEKQSRLGKNPKRVGANFRQQVAMETNEDWLPNFGQVWSFGPRSQSRLNFRRGQQTGPLLTSSDFSSHSAAPDSRGLDEGGVVRPYIRKRKKLNSSVD